MPDATKYTIQEVIDAVADAFAADPAMVLGFIGCREDRAIARREMGEALRKRQDIFEAEKLRDTILRTECRMNPDGTPIKE